MMISKGICTANTTRWSDEDNERQQNQQCFEQAAIFSAFAKSEGGRHGEEKYELVFSFVI